MNKILASLLMLILLMQALLASADMHQFHQPVQGHLEYASIQVDPYLDDLRTQNDVDDQGESCKHCCQCHGGSVVYLSGPVSTMVQAAAMPISIYRISATSPRARSPELRPPIV